MRFAKDRSGYRHRLRQAVVGLDLSLLTSNITCNHVHLIAYAQGPDQIICLMQQAAGEFARDYNRRKTRSGAFWEGRYHVTMIDSGDYLWECLKYVELNMVRCGVVAHPRDWQWSGYGERMGWRKRNRLLDLEKLLWLVRAATLEDFQTHFNFALQEAIIKGELKRQEKWAGAVAVGSLEFVEGIKDRIATRQQMDAQQEGGTWVLREDYGSFSERENASMRQF